MTTEKIAAELRQTAAGGGWAMEAGVELLIRQGRAMQDTDAWVTRTPLMTALPAPDRLHEVSRAYSSGERAVVDVALSLIAAWPVDLAKVIPGLDESTVGLIMTAIAHAAGVREPMVCDTW